jgi:hypothetical protein
LEHVGLGPLLQFVDNKDNPNYDDEFILLMSHPDTHAAYNRAYRIWKDDKDGEVGFDHFKVDTTRVVPFAPRDDPDPWTSRSVSDERYQEPDMSDPFWIAASAHDAGYQYGSEKDPRETDSQRVNMYIYGDSSPVKAIVEWPGYTMDDTYLAGLWKADLLNQLRWYCLKPGHRALKYRAPTWSWASVDNVKISYRERSLLDYSRNEGGWSEPDSAKLLGAEAVPSGSNRFGDVKSARLTLLAPIRSMPLFIDEYENLARDRKSMTILEDSEPVETIPKLDSENLYLDEKSKAPLHLCHAVKPCSSGKKSVARCSR